MAPKWFRYPDLDPSSTIFRRWLGYGAAVVGPTLAFLLEWALQRGALRLPLYPFFTLAIIASALAWGLRPGLLALGLSLFYNLYFILVPQHWPPSQHREDWLALTAFAGLGVVISVIGTLLRRSHQALQEKAAQLRTVVDSISARLYVCDSSGLPLLTNEAFRANYPLARAPSYPQSFVDGVEVFDLSGRPVPLSDWPISRALRGEQVRGLELRVRYKQSGRELIHSYNAAPVVDANGNVSMAVLTAEDISERKQAEAALIRTEKLASVGRLAATVAHEINNPLEAATSALYLANLDPALSPETRDALRLADQELHRAAHIAHQTLGFCRENTYRTPLSLPKVIDEVVRVYERKLRDRGITVQRTYKCGPCQKECEACFFANAGELRQVISNLLGNAIDALEDNGTLHVRLCRMSGFQGGPKIRLTVADNGCGICTENLKRIFEPFYTTKESVGTGLGLWISQEIIGKYNGTIRTRSQKGKGTVFCVTVPAMPLAPGAGQNRELSA